MLFSSLVFLYVFLPITMAVYYLAPKKYRNLILMVASLIFYAWGEPFYIIILIISSAIDYLSGLIINKYWDNEKVKKLALFTSLFMNLTLLSLFKYLGFIITNLNSVFNLDLVNPNLPFPIGISFFTFQTMSYTIDMYRGNIKVQRNFINFLTYVSMFPQIVAGPIVRYSHIENEINQRKISYNMVGEGIYIFITGLGKKVLIANNVGLIWESVKSGGYGSLSAAAAWLGIIAFAFQIYFDFSGYSDMAIGLGKMLGFNLPKNFNYPYMAKSISDFWRRWHITMGDWFKHYVYFPLGGSRKKLSRTVINLLIVWFITGFWHGANWNFILWGLYFGILIILEKLFLGKVLDYLPRFFSSSYTFIAVLFGWVIFEAALPKTLGDGGAVEYFFNGLAFQSTNATQSISSISFSEIITNITEYFSAMFGGNGVFVDAKALYIITNNWAMLIVCVICSTNLVKIASDNLLKKLPPWAEYGVPLVKIVIFFLSTQYLVDSSYNAFLYYNF